CQMVCFIDSTRLLPRQRMTARRCSQEESDAFEARMNAKIEKEKRAEKMKEEGQAESIKVEIAEGTEKKSVEDENDLMIRFEHDTSPFITDTRGFLVRRPGYRVQKTAVKIIRRSEFESQQVIDA
ncbi:hypothetical protein PFISCL1PPCAC_22616, partial [Pristionchus fissidentatus]